MAQAQKDLRLWTGLSQEVDLSKNIGLEFTEEVRFNNNISNIEKHLYQAGLNFKLGDVYSFNPSFRFTDEVTNFSYRIQLDQQLNHNLPNKYWIKQRLRLHYDYENPQLIFSDLRLRYRFSVVKKYGKDFFIYAEPEIFYRYKYDYQSFYQYRLEAGIKIEMGKGDWSSLKLSYIYEHEYFVENPVYSHILGFNWKVSLF